MFFLADLLILTYTKNEGDSLCHSKKIRTGGIQQDKLGSL